MPETIKLKKYTNRRLYDTGRSAYITLEDVDRLIRRGDQVTVEDAKSGEDVTAYILTQIVLEQAKQKNTLLPSQVLHMIIRYGDNRLEEFFGQYLHLTMEAYLAHKEAMDLQFRKWLDLGADFSQVARKTMARLTPLKSLFEPFTGTKEVAPEAGPENGRN